MKSWMKKTVCALAGLALVGSCAAMAEGEKDYGERVPESLVYESCWAADGMLLEAVSEDDGFRVSITAAGIEGNTVWEYSPLYNAETGALEAPFFGTKTVETLDLNGDVSAWETVYDDGGAVFTLDGNGCLKWQDTKEDAGKDLVFKKIGRFAGTYACGRALIGITWDYEDAYDIMIQWGDSASVTYSWNFKGVYDPASDTLEALGMETRTEYDENGEIVSVEDVTEEGCEAVFSFNDDGKLIWSGTEGANTDGMEFEYYDPFAGES